MDSKVFIASGIVLLLLFGCVGRGGTPAPPVQKPSLPGAGIGDSDIDVAGSVNDTELTTNVSEIEPPENGSAQGGTAQSGVVSTTLDALDSEMFVTQINETDLIMEVEGVEAG